MTEEMAWVSIGTAWSKDWVISDLGRKEIGLDDKSVFEINTPGWAQEVCTLYFLDDDLEEIKNLIGGCAMRGEKCGGCCDPGRPEGSR